MTIYANTITKVFVTWKLKALYHGDHNYCQYQGSKKIKYGLDPLESCMSAII